MLIQTEGVHLGNFDSEGPAFEFVFPGTTEFAQGEVYNAERFAIEDRGDYLRHVRKVAGKTQKQIANEAEVNLRTVKRIEGQQRDPLLTSIDPVYRATGGTALFLAISESTVATSFEMLLFGAQELPSFKPWFIRTCRAHHITHNDIGKRLGRLFTQTKHSFLFRETTYPPLGVIKMYTTDVLGLQAEFCGLKSQIYGK